MIEMDFLVLPFLEQTSAWAELYAKIIHRSMLGCAPYSYRTPAGA